ncbi:recombinase family protein [Azospirillum sp. SYSU D00513]|uniref:recombinase family protein n=1 Tax=Azospirillum sp. SYSU D00513 TaxID=2812561 RepID=UPI001A9687D6|nr:recombinase family protein [Azospirillum sp. SYSU D00513]
MLIGYARVSTVDQTLEGQTDALAWAGVEPGRIYTDKATGAHTDRAGLAEAMRALRPGDTLVAVALDRLARSLKELIGLAERIEAAGAGLRILNQGIDTTTPGGRLVFHMLGAIAEFERALIKERTAAGLRAAKERGRRGGRKLKLSGSKLTAARAMWADPRLTVDDIAEQAGVSLKTLYRHLGPRTPVAGPAAS